AISLIRAGEMKIVRVQAEPLDKIGWKSGPKVRRACTVAENIPPRTTVSVRSPWNGLKSWAIFTKLPVVHALEGHQRILVGRCRRYHDASFGQWYGTNRVYRPPRFGPRYCECLQLAVCQSNHYCGRTSDLNRTRKDGLITDCNLSRGGAACRRGI